MLTAPRAPSLGADALVRERIRAPDWRPPALPVEALEVHRQSMIPQASPAPLLGTLARSEALSIEVLRVARSAAYAGTEPPRDLQEAAARLGSRSLADLVMQVALGRCVYPDNGRIPELGDLRRSAIAAAHAARAIALRTGARQGLAFLGGLLHPAGYAVSLAVLGEIPARHRPSLAESWPGLQAVHQEARALTLRSWAIPQDVRAVLQQADPGRDDLRAAAAAVHLGIAIGEAVAPTPLTGQEAQPRVEDLLGPLGIPADRWLAIAARARAAATRALVD